MAQEQHTPGPWILNGEVRRISDTLHYCADITDGRPCKGYRGCIAYIQTADHLTHGMRIDEGKANARLIAAAPDLLAALREANAFILAPAEDLKDGVLSRIRAAISEAIGPRTAADAINDIRADLAEIAEAPHA